MVILTEASSSPSYDHKYDVFLSFRGFDTRLNFTNHLHKALVDANLTTFYDDEEIQTGECLKPELENAIKASRASVIVLSENYASSTWCLEELVLILEQKRDSNQIVIPVFYHVEPTHVRKQESSFGEAMEKHKRKMESESNVKEKCRLGEKMEIWKSALTEVSNLKGKDADGRLETNLIEEIVNDLYSRLRVPLGITTLPLLIGMEYHIKRITSWLIDGSSHTADILTILGVSGIGKTSLAYYVYELHRREFTCSSFVRDISRRHDEKFHGLLDLQKQLYGDISKGNLARVHDVSGHTSMIWKALAREKVLLVLDDIDSLDQLDAFLCNKGLYPGSKIIITTKDGSLIERCALFNPHVQPKHREVLLHGLYESPALELLCIHAFKCHKLKEGYERVSKMVVKHCDGHPLAIEVLGRSLHKRDVAYWEDCIEELKKEPNFRVQKPLQMSYDSLPFKNDKELFKHIACFFVGADRDLTETIINACNIKTRSGIINLIDRCLLSITWNNKLMMHTLIQEMGRDLVRQESPDKPWERSRLWCPEESFKVLEQKEGTKNVLGLALDMRMLEEEKLQLKTDALNKMDNLKFLQLNYVKIKGSFKNVSKELRWLCMHGFYLKSIPSQLPMQNLVVLDMSHSNIESFDMSYSSSQRSVKRQKRLVGSSSKDKRFLGSLKILDLSFCEQLHSLGGFFELPALEKLVISYCTSLIMFSESIQHCVELLFIDLSNCKKLEKLPRSIGKLKKINTLLANGCDLLFFPSELREMDSLKTVESENMGINSQTSSSSCVELIAKDLWSFMSCLPVSLVQLSLKNNNLSNKSFPMDFSSLSVLKMLDLDDNPIVSMPGCVRSLPRLEHLSMMHCLLLETVEHPPNSLKNLVLVNVGMLQEMKFNPEMSPLYLGFSTSEERSMVIEGIIKVQPLEHVEHEVLRSLGWSNFELIKYQHVMFSNSKEKKLRIQMYYEFGIFSTVYGGKEMPNWISLRSEGSSISFTIPSSPKKLRGLNFCYVMEKLSYSDKLFDLPVIKISNSTKNVTWIYSPYILKVNVAEERLIFVSHWMFGENEMEDGDHITIMENKSSKPGIGVIKECGIGLVYDENEKNKDEEDVLRYYKSWNHIIGGDLSFFQTTTGEYTLFNRLFFWYSHVVPHHPPFDSDSSDSKGDGLRFRAFSQRKSDLVVHPMLEM